MKKLKKLKKPRKSLPAPEIPEKLPDEAADNKTEKAVSPFLLLFLPKKGKVLHTNRSMFFSCLFIVILFSAMMGYLVRFMMFDSEKVIANPYNKRTESLKAQIIRGRIISADGQVLARTVEEDEDEEDGEEKKERRDYPYGRTFSHVVGYASHGQSGLESVFNYALLSSHTDISTQFSNGIHQQKNPGDDVITTLDTRLQEAAYDALGDYRGAVVAMEPSTGRILALVSKPDYNPNSLDDIWSEIINDENSSVLLNRVTQGLYPPGSTYKVLTALEYVQEHLHSYNDFKYNCKGETIIHGVKIHCYKEAEHGKEDLKEAFAHSCNTAFVTLGTGLDRKKLIDLNEHLLFNQRISSDLPVSKSRFKITAKSEDSELPQTVIGQGDTLMTPLHNALIMSAIANGGDMMRPMLVDRIQSREGTVIRRYEPRVLLELEEKEAVPVMQKMLRQVVTDGTASLLQDEDYQAAGKTGTAENEKEDPHSWFVGYAGKEKPDLVVCVLVENTGAGSKYAVPIAREIFNTYYEDKEE